VLLADDHGAVLKSVTAVLAPHYDVIGAVRDGAALIEAAKSLDPDVLVVDISMPVLNGIQAVARLKHDGSRAKVVFLTINEGADFVQACFAVGATGYVVKVRLFSDLVFAMNEVLADRSFVSPTLTVHGGLNVVTSGVPGLGGG
jgi:DNA-binding NarL/FixJ family response regulator